MIIKQIKKYIEKLKSSKKSIQDVGVSTIPGTYTAVTGIITSILIARGLGPSGLGQYALIVSVSTLIIMFSDLGIGSTVVRYGASAVSKGDIEGQHAIFRWAFRIRFMIIALLALILFLAIPFLMGELWHQEKLITLTRYCLISGIFGAIAGIPLFYFQSLKKFKTNAIVSVCQTSINFIGILIIFLLNMWDIKWLVVTNIASYTLGSLIFLAIVPKTIFFDIQETWEFFKGKFSLLYSIPARFTESQKILGHSIYSFTFFSVLASIVGSIINRVDIWLIGSYLNAYQVGLYDVARRLTFPLTFIFTAINTVIYPKFSSVNSITETFKLLKKTIILLLGFVFLLLLYSIFFPLLSPYIFGESFKDSVLIAQLLCIRYCLATLFNPVTLSSYNLGFIKYEPVKNFAVLIIFTTISVIFLPKVGILASVYAYLSCTCLEIISISLYVYFKSKKQLAKEAAENSSAEKTA